MPAKELSSVAPAVVAPSCSALRREMIGVASSLDLESDIRLLFVFSHPSVAAVPGKLEVFATMNIDRPPGNADNGQNRKTRHKDNGGVFLVETVANLAQGALE